MRDIFNTESPLRYRHDYSANHTKAAHRLSRHVFERGPAGAGVALGLGGGADLELCDRVYLPVGAADRVFVANVLGVEHRPAGDADVSFYLCQLF